MPAINPGQPLVADRQAALGRLSKMLADAPGQGPDVHQVFTQVDQMVYRGRLPTGGEMGDLKTIGIKHIVTFLDPAKGEGDLLKQELLDAKAAGIKVTNIPWAEDSPHKMISAARKKFLAVMAKLGDVLTYIHCKHGENRTGYMTAVRSIADGEQTTKQALKTMEKMGYDEAKYPALKVLVKKFGHKVGDAVVKNLSHPHL